MIRTIQTLPAAIIGLLLAVFITGFAFVADLFDKTAMDDREGASWG